jgi:hypothetical protein
MADELMLIKQRLDLLDKQHEVLGKSMGLEFERISKAFAQMGNLLDLLYLEVSVLIEMLSSKKVITQEEFTKTLEDTAKKVEEEIAKAAKDAKEKEAPIVKL